MASIPIIVEHIPRETPIGNVDFARLSECTTNRGRGEARRCNTKIVNLLNQAGLTTFGDLLDFVNAEKPLQSLPGVGGDTVWRISLFFNRAAMKPDGFQHNNFDQWHPSFEKSKTIPKTPISPLPDTKITLHTPGVPFTEKLTLAVAGVDASCKQTAERLFLQGAVLLQ